MPSQPNSRPRSTKRPAGRPRKYQQPRQATVTFELTELRQIREKAKASKSSVGDLIRRWTLKFLTPPE